MTASLEGFEVSGAARSLYSFVWNEFCDWYLEMAKLTLREEGAEQQQAARQVLRYVLEAILRLLHPFMPFVTEEIWQRMPGAVAADPSIMRAPWPDLLPDLVDPRAEEDFERVREVVSTIRSFRADHRVDSGAKMHVHLSAADPSDLEAVGRQRATVGALARVHQVSLDGDGLHNGMADGQGPATRLVAGPVDVLIPLTGVLDLDAERDRLRRALEKTGSEIRRLEGKLAGEQFRAKAPPEVVAGEERKLQEAQATEARLRTQLSEIGG